jgi:VWFA-related protein
MTRFFAVLLLTICGYAAQQNPQPAAAPQQPAQPTTPVIRTGAQEVLLDVVVRDKKGKLIRDLKPEEVQVFDEGTVQKVNSFRLVTGSEPVALGSTDTEPKKLDPLRQIRLVTLLFTGLDNEARRLSRSAALDFLGKQVEQNVFISVFTIDRQLHVLQQFTNDRELIKQAIDKATSGHLLEFTARSNAIRQELVKVKDSLANSGTPSMPGRGSSDSSSAGQSAATAKMAQMTLDILGYSESLYREDASRASLYSILALVKDQAMLPGRKTVVYFSDGLDVSESMTEQFKDIIAAANRAGVSVYGVDARGLMMESQNEAGKWMLSDAAGSSAAQQTADVNAVGGVSEAQIRVFDNARDSIHANRQEALATLATSTGGKLIANTNDLRGPLQQVREDVLMYYEIAYAPGITNFDGKFRRIGVKVARNDIRVQARSGYFALPPGAEPAVSFETPLLAALSQAVLPTSFPFSANALRFGRPADKVDYALVIEVPMKDFTFAEEKENKRYRAHLSYLAVIKDAQNQVVQRVSRDLGMYAPADKLEQFKKRPFVGTFRLQLPAGRYTLESAVVDREALKASARRTTVVVPGPAAGVAISNLALVRRTELEAKPLDPADPFHYQGKRIVPMLENAVQKSGDTGLSFYLIVSPAAGSTDKVEVTMELAQYGTVIAKAPLPLPAPNERGVIPYLAALPLASFPEGQYELKFTAKQGSSQAEDQLVFTVNP